MVLGYTFIGLAAVISALSCVMIRIFDILRKPGGVALTYIIMCIADAFCIVMGVHYLSN